MSAEKGKNDAQRCCHCERDVDVCACCGRTDCKNSVCFRCQQIDLEQATAKPFSHGR